MKDFNYKIKEYKGEYYKVKIWLLQEWIEI